MTGAARGAARQQALRRAVAIELWSVLWIFAEALLSLAAARQSGSLALSAFGVDSAIELLSGLVLLVRLSLEATRPAAAAQPVDPSPQTRAAGHPHASAGAARRAGPGGEGPEHARLPDSAQSPPGSRAGGPDGSGANEAAMARMERAAAAVVAGCLFALAAFVAWKSGQAISLRQTPAASPLGLAVTAASSVVTPWLALRKQRLGRALGSQALLGDAACSFACAWMAWTLLAGMALQWWFGAWWIDPLAALGIVYFVVREAWASAESAWHGLAHAH